MPLVFLGISSLFNKSRGKSFAVLGVFVIIAVLAIVVHFAYWWRFKNGKETVYAWLEARGKRETAYKNLPSILSSIETRLDAIDGGVVNPVPKGGEVEMEAIQAEKPAAEAKKPEAEAEKPEAEAEKPAAEGVER